MNGVLRTTLLFYSFSKIQRWCVAVALAVLVMAPTLVKMVCRCSSSYPLWSPPIQSLQVMSLGAVLGIGATMFRRVSALQTLRLIPHARVQLLLGLLLALILLAGMMSASIAVLHGESWFLFFARPNPTDAFKWIFALSTLWVLTLFFVAGSRVQAVIALLVVLILFSVQAAFGPKEPSRINIAGLGFSDLLALAAIVAWLLFAVWYLRNQQIVWGISGNGRRNSKAAQTTVVSRDLAIKTYLLGQSSALRASRTLLLTLVGYNLALVAIQIIMPLRHRMLPEFSTGMASLLLFPFFGLIGNNLAVLITRGSRNLWIRSGSTRPELFATAERLGWQCLGVVGAPMLALSAAEWVGLPHHFHDTQFYVYALVVFLELAACGLYLGLLNFRGSKLNVRFMILYLAVSGGVLLYPSYTYAPLTPLLRGTVPVALLVAVITLRSWVKGRWQRVDWLFCKPERLWRAI